MKDTNVLVNVFSFFLGMFVGAVIALLMTPESGSDLRAKIGEKAGAARQQIRSEYERSINWAEEEVEKLRKDLPSESGT